MSWIQIIILSIIEGMTEFLPISSTAHMLVASKFLGVGENPFTNLFFAAVQVGAILAIVVLYFNLFIKSLKIYYLLLIAFIPTAIVGILLNNFVNKNLATIPVMGAALIIGGIVFIRLNKIIKKPLHKNLPEITYKNAFFIGLIQCLALIPGVSRSGATMIGGLFQHLNRYTSVQFAFLLGLPACVAATCKSLYELYKNNADIYLSNLELTQIIVANIISFSIAIMVASKFINYVNKKGFRELGLYRVIIGLLLLILYFTRLI